MPSHESGRPGIALTLDAEVLRPLIAAVVAETVATLDRDRSTLGDKLAFTEAEAARLLGLNTHQLRDERLRKRVAASQIVGNRVRYTRADLIRYLMCNRTGD